jgi:ATP-dependent RNA helicase RhlE
VQFESFGFHATVAAGIKGAGYTVPTPIQAEAIPPVMERKDVMGLAQTGTGKTAAFALPILQRLLQGEKKRVRALVLAPTRELAAQIDESFRLLGKETGLKSVAIYGGVSMKNQIDTLKRGVEIVVACPGRLLDHLGQGTIDLSRVEVLVLDEADHMFDMGFLPDVRRIVKQLPRERQTLLFSATMPDEIRRLSAEVLRNPVTVQVGNTAPPVTVSHVVYPVAQHLKTPLLMELLRSTETGSVLIFTRTKHRAKRVGEQLAKVGHKAASIQGNLSQNRRQEAMDGFRDGSYRILVATDIAARGIDVSEVSHVINYDIPDTPETYVHRIGRTGRAARTGDAFTFITSEDDAMVRAIERKLGAPLERLTVEGFDYKAPAPQANEFARPPMVRQQRRPAGEGKKPASAAPGGSKPRPRARQGNR